MSYDQISRNIETALIKLGSQDKFQLYEKFGTSDCNICLSDNHNMVGVFQCGHCLCNKCCSTIISSNALCHICRQTINKVVYYVMERPKHPQDLLDQLDILIRQIPAVAEIRVVETNKTQTIGNSIVTLKYGLTSISDTLNPCVIKLKASQLNPSQTILQLGFLIDISGSMHNDLPILLDNLCNIISAMPHGSTISIHTFNHDYFLIVPETVLSSTTLSLILQKLKNIYAFGRTSLHLGIEGVREHINKQTQMIIITDGQTNDTVLATNEFRQLRDTNPVLLIGLGANYSYDNCLPIVNGDATVFEEATDSNSLSNTINSRIKTGVKVEICTKSGNNIYTTVKSQNNRTEFIPYDTELTIVFDNGLPSTITVDDVNISLHYDQNLDKQSCILLYEFTINDYLKTLGNNVISDPGEALNVKMLAQDLRQRITQDKSLISTEAHDRLMTFIKDLIKTYTEIITNTSCYGFAYGGGLGRDSSNSVGRALSGGLRASSSM